MYLSQIYVLHCTMNAGDDKENVEEEEEASGSSSTDMCGDKTENDCCAARPVHTNSAAVCNGEARPIHTNSAICNGDIKENECCAARPAHTNSTVCNGEARPIHTNSAICNGDRKENECCMGRPVHTNSAVCNGARPKTSNISSSNYSLKLNNNDSEKLHNGNDLDVYVRNNVDCCVTVDKCPSKVRSHDMRQYRGQDDEDSLSENEEGDEYCIYTYKGDENQMADLPSSFFRLGVAQPPGAGRESRSSSPDMDYLEMDFDPGPSNDRGDSSEDSDCCDMQHDERLDSVSNEVSPRVDRSPAEPVDHHIEDVDEEEDMGAVGENSHSPTINVDTKNDLNGSGPPVPATPSPPPPVSAAAAVHPPTVVEGVEGEHDSPPVESSTWSGVVDYLNSQSDSATDAEKYNLRSALYHCIMAKRLVLDKQESFTDCDQSNMHLKENTEASSPDANRPVEKIMIWSEKEASAKQVTQIGTSLCGVTAIVNVLVALNMPFSLDKLKEAVGTRFRREDAPVPEYLLSRCMAGVTHHDIIKAVDAISQGSLYARFFCMYPPRSFSLLRWLASWMKKGAIALATLNPQRVGSTGGGGEGLADCWHHQMVFGVGPRGVYLTNPLECVDEASMLMQLSSESVLRVRRADVINRWTPATDLTPLTRQPHRAWNSMNVLGQVVNIIREEKWNRQGLNRTLTSHISIPASYSSGITLIMSRQNPAFEQLVNAPQLPLAPT
ncbi:uncharacterized protein LOC111046183 isoform X2 [Nilaparvata lugens]|uniref:uncharacterized protein LOC111046183 isoform X2 n=1 Tax=Nilaparvata lugens TaxID=108931 RepID=UPI00193D6671|nr:uncharacterized protein LOC111046183 isoform X2 [Nilaparvata lugens]